MIFNMIIIFIIIILTLTWSPIIIIMRDTGTPGSLWFIQLSSWKWTSYLNVKM